MAAYTIATHPVKDFDVWKSVFDKFEPVRKERGERSAVVLRHADDSNMVTIINTWDTIETAQAFFSQEELKAAMGEAGVTAPPTFVFANEAQTEQEAAGEVPDDLVDSLALIGPKEQIRDQVAEWKESAATTLLVGGDPNAIELMAELCL